MTVAFALTLMLVSSQHDAHPACLAQPSDCREVASFDLVTADGLLPVKFSGSNPWLDDGRLSLYVNESVTLQVKPAGGVEVVSYTPSSSLLADSATAAFMQVLERAQSGQAEAAYVDSSMLKLSPPLAEGQVRLTFRQAPSSEAMILVIENSYEEVLAYTGGMLAPYDGGLAWEATPVCTVFPDMPGVEFWPHPIVSLSLGDFAFVDSQEMVCR